MCHVVLKMDRLSVLVGEQILKLTFSSHFTVKCLQPFFVEGASFAAWSFRSSEASDSRWSDWMVPVHHDPFCPSPGNHICGFFGFSVQALATKTLPLWRALDIYSYIIFVRIIHFDDVQQVFTASCLLWKVTATPPRGWLGFPDKLSWRENLSQPRIGETANPDVAHALSAAWTLYQTKAYSKIPVEQIKLLVHITTTFSKLITNSLAFTMCTRGFWTLPPPPPPSNRLAEVLNNCRVRCRRETCLHWISTIEIWLSRSVIACLWDEEFRTSRLSRGHVDSDGLPF